MNKKRGNYYISGGIINGGLGLIGQTINNMNPSIPQTRVEDTNSYAMNNDQIMNDWASWSPINHFTKKDFGVGKSNIIGSAIGNTVQGAMSGGGIGGVAGGIVGGLVGLGSSIFGSNKRKRALRRANREVDDANNRTLLNLTNRVNNIATTTNWNNLANYSAFGGNLYALGGNFLQPSTLYGGGSEIIDSKPNDKLSMISSLLEQAGKLFNNKDVNVPTGNDGGNPLGNFNFGSLLSNINAYGGIMPITDSVERQLQINGNNIFSNGGQFSNGVTTFNNGGTHEENPYGGIFQGIGENGEPNLVEEGEVKWNDYIFSDRLVIPMNVKDYNLPSTLSGKTFAKAAEYLQEESKEREVNSISKLGLNINLSRLASLQESEKQMEDNNVFKEGGSLIKPKNRGKFTEWAKRHNMSVSEATSHVLKNKDKYPLNVRRMAQFSRNFGGNALGGELNHNYFANGGPTSGLNLDLIRPSMFNRNDISGTFIGNINNTEPVKKNNKTTNKSASNMLYDKGTLQDDLYNAYLKAGVDNPQMIIALITQDMIESGFGRGVQGKYNFGNITSGSNYKGKTVEGKDRDANGNKISQKFRSYDSIEDYAKDKISLLKRRYDFDQNDDINTFANKLAGDNSSKYRYAQDADYANKLIRAFNGDTSVRAASYINPDVEIINTGSSNISSPTTSIDNSNLANSVNSVTQSNNNIDNNTTTPVTLNNTTPVEPISVRYADDRVVPIDVRSVDNNSDTLLRYAPVIANAGLTLGSIFETPEKYSFNRSNERVGAGKLGNYMRYNPMDFEYLANRIRQQGAATRSSIRNNSGGNRATSTAGILAADYQLNNALGNAYTQVQELNNNRRNQVEEFNRGTNMFNIQNDLQSQLANQRNTQFNTEISNNELLANAQSRANRRNAIRQGISTIATELGQIGKENRYMKIAPKLSGGYDSLANYINRINSNKFGGGLKIYKKVIK